MSNIISFFQKLIKGGGGWNKSGGGLENFSKINKRGGDDYSVLESIHNFHKMYQNMQIIALSTGCRKH